MSEPTEYHSLYPRSGLVKDSRVGQPANGRRRGGRLRKCRVGLKRVCVRSNMDLVDREAGAPATRSRVMVRYLALCLTRIPGASGLTQIQLRDCFSRSDCVPLGSYCRS